MSTGGEPTSAPNSSPHTSPRPCSAPAQKKPQLTHGSTVSVHGSNVMIAHSGNKVREYVVTL